MAEHTEISWADAPARRGPPPNPPRDGDRKQARQRINVLVRTGKIPHPNTLACVDCGHAWAKGERRHEYDHHKGYGPDHHLDVEPVCTTCHHVRTGRDRTHCAKGHEFTPENTLRKKTGSRLCRTCRRAHDQNRTRPPGYWKAVNARRYPDGRK